MEGYCLKCKQKREMKNVQEKVSERGMKMAMGICPVCGTKMTKFLGKA